MLNPGLVVEGDVWGNVTSCRVISLHKEVVVMAYLEVDCTIVVEKGELEMIGIDCDQLEEQGLLVDLMGSVLVELKDNEMMAVFSGEELFLC